MNWLVIALIAPVLWSISSYVDKYIFSKYFKAGGIGSLTVITSLFDALALPIIFVVAPNSFQIPFFHALVLMLLGVLSICQVFLYYKAIKEEEPSIVMPLFQMIPVITYGLAYFILHESLSQKQLLASALVLIGAIVLSADIAGKSFKIKKNIFLLILASSVVAAVDSIVFKVMAIEESFWVAMFWNFAGAVLTGLSFLFVKNYRDEFIEVVKSNSKFIIVLNGLSEITAIIASLCFSYATLLVPITLVWIINGLQPFFGFIIGISLAYFFPKISSESLLKKHLIQKILAIGVIFLGTYFLNS